MNTNKAKPLAAERKLLRRPISTIKIGEVIKILKENRAKDIVCIEIPPSEGPFPCVIICSPFNSRYAFLTSSIFIILLINKSKYCYTLCNLVLGIVLSL